MDEININVIKESFGRVAYSHKTQEKAKEINELFAILVKWFNVLLIGATASSAIYNFFLAPEKVSILTAILSTISLMFIIAQLSFAPEAKAREHRKCANKLWLIREKYLNLLTDMVTNNVTNENVKERRDQISAELFDVYNDAPSAGGWAYKRARKALKFRKELSFTSKEIDQLLPESMKGKGK